MSRHIAVTASHMARAASSILVIVSVTFALSLAAGGAAAAPVAGDAAAAPAAHGAPHAKQDIGVFTGTFVNGMPLYRLPPINVVAHRSVELARIAQEEQQARLRKMRAKLAVKHQGS
jgi:hypothetical protein